MTVLVLLSAAVACRGSEPRVQTAATLAGDWVLVEREGQRLPATSHRTLPGIGTCTSVLIRSVVSLRADGTWTEEVEARTWCDGSPEPDTSALERSSGRFELRGTRGDTINLFTADENPANHQKGVISGDELQLEYALPARNTTTIRYRYERAQADR